MENSLSNSKFKLDDDILEESKSSLQEEKEIKLERNDENRQTPINGDKSLTQNDQVKSEFNLTADKNKNEKSAIKDEPKDKNDSRLKSPNTSNSSNASPSTSQQPKIDSSTINSNLNATGQPGLHLPSGLQNPLANPFLPPTGLGQVPLFDPLYAPNSKLNLISFCKVFLWIFIKNIFALIKTNKFIKSRYFI